MLVADLSFESAQSFDFSGLDWLQSCKYMNKEHADRLSRFLGDGAELRIEDLQRWRWHGLICLNFEKLPCAKLTEVKRLPKTPAIYFVLTDRLVYIGKTKNLRNRWYRHHCLSLVAQSPDIRVAWVEALCCDDTLTLMERGFIDSFNPDLNGKKTGQTTPWRKVGGEGELSEIGKLANSHGMNRYRFWKATGLSQVTAYRLYEDSGYNPSKRVRDAVCKALRMQPGEWLQYVPDDELAA